mgnify:CR=1 FL=1|jgi:hypothetical protein|tara:strand:+ start:412 stop:615 length:204 start_codon:yes stop_codon:yes gene_type:complete
MHNIVKLIEDSKSFSNELQTEVLPVSVVRKIVEELYTDKFNLALSSIQESVTEVNEAIRKIAEGDAE